MLNNSSFELINYTPIDCILDKLHIGYKKSNGNLYLVQDEKLTAGWTVNLLGNYVNDFSKDRPKGGPFAFVKAYLKLTDRETFEWFKDHFGIVGSASERKVSHKEIKKGLKIQYHRNW